MWEKFLFYLLKKSLFINQKKEKKKKDEWREGIEAKEVDGKVKKNTHT